MVKYVIRKENDILYYDNGEWVSKDKADGLMSRFSTN